MALTFVNANPDGVNLQDITTLDGLAAMTISAWVRLTTLIDYQWVINKGPSIGTQWGMQASGATEGTNNDVTCNTKNGGTDATQDGYTTGNFLAADGVFHHWCMVYNGGGATNADRLKFYFDAVQRTLTYRGTIPATLNANTNSAYLGSAEWDAGAAFNGSLVDVRAYNRALSQSEIETIYFCRGHDNIVDSLVAKYQLDEQPPPTAISYPTVASVTPTSFAGNSVNHNVAMPATVNAGDQLIIQIAVESASLAGATPTGWTQLFAPVVNATVNWVAYGKIADGTEGGTTVNVVSGVAGNGAAQVYRILDVNPSGVLVGVATTGGSTTPDPPSLGSTTGDEAWLWLALSGGADDDESYTGGPAGFTNLTSTLSGGGVNNSAEVGSARLNQSTQPVNPGTFTLSGSEAWGAQTMAIRPSAWVKDVAGGNNGSPIEAPTYAEDSLSKRRRFI